MLAGFCFELLSARLSDHISLGFCLIPLPPSAHDGCSVSLPCCLLFLCPSGSLFTSSVFFLLFLGLYYLLTHPPFTHTHTHTHAYWISPSFSFWVSLVFFFLVSVTFSSTPLHTHTHTHTHTHAHTLDLYPSPSGSLSSSIPGSPSSPFSESPPSYGVFIPLSGCLFPESPPPLPLSSLLSSPWVSVPPFLWVFSLPPSSPLPLSLWDVFLIVFLSIWVSLPLTPSHPDLARFFVCSRVSGFEFHLPCLVYLPFSSFSLPLFSPPPHLCTPHCSFFSFWISMFVSPYSSFLIFPPPPCPVFLRASLSGTLSVCLSVSLCVPCSSSPSIRPSAWAQARMENPPSALTAFSAGSTGTGWNDWRSRLRSDPARSVPSREHHAGP